MVQKSRRHSMYIEISPLMIEILAFAFEMTTGFLNVVLGQPSHATSILSADERSDLHGLASLIRSMRHKNPAKHPGSASSITTLPWSSKALVSQSKCSDSMASSHSSCSKATVTINAMSSNGTDSSRETNTLSRDVSIRVIGRNAEVEEDSKEPYGSCTASCEW
jgi:hypothetical protein